MARSKKSVSEMEEGLAAKLERNRILLKGADVARVQGRKEEKGPEGPVAAQVEDRPPVEMKRVPLACPCGNREATVPDHGGLYVCRCGRTFRVY